MGFFKRLTQPVSKEEVPKTRSYYREKYGRYEGHFAWDLACEWFKMGNDVFFETYGFNFVPEGELFDDAKEHVYYPIK